MFLNNHVQINRDYHHYFYVRSSAQHWFVNLIALFVCEFKIIIWRN